MHYAIIFYNQLNEELLEYYKNVLNYCYFYTRLIQIVNQTKSKKKVDQLQHLGI